MESHADEMVRLSKGRKPMKRGNISDTMRLDYLERLAKTYHPTARFFVAGGEVLATHEIENEPQNSIRKAIDAALRAAEAGKGGDA